MNPRDRLVLALLAAFAVTASAEARQVIRTFTGTSPGDRAGRAVDVAGDVNADGVTDFVVGMPGADVNGTDSGTVVVFSGADGAVLLTAHGSAAGDMLGGAVAGAGDVNGDGHADVVVGATSDTITSPPWGGGYARVLSGADGAVLFHHAGSGPGRTGFAVAGIGDVNGDGHADYAVGSPGTGQGCSFLCSGWARVYSGADGSLMRWHGPSDDPDGNNGFSIDDLSDVDGDGVDDYVIGEIQLSDHGSNYVGRGHVYSGATGASVLHVIGVNVTYLMGRASSGAGDVDGDGVEDVVFAEAGASHLWSVSGTLLRSHVGSYLKVSELGDLNADGRGDYLMADSEDVVHLFSGLDGTELAAYSGGVGDDFGASVEGAGDVDGDGIPDFLVGAPQETGGGPGYVQVISGYLDCNGNGLHDGIELAQGSVADCNYNSIPDACDIASGSSDLDQDGVPDECQCAIESFCTATPNSTGFPAALVVTGSNSVAANDIVLRAVLMPALMNGLFIYSRDPAEVPLGNGILCLGNRTQGFVNRLPFATSDGTGAMTHALDLTAPPVPESLILPGTTWYFQAWFRDVPAGGAGFDFSDGVRIRFCP